LLNRAAGLRSTVMPGKARIVSQSSRPIGSQR